MAARALRQRAGWRAGGISGISAEDGSQLVEFAVTLPVLLTLIFCFMEMCMALYSYEMISDLAREGTRYARVRGASCPSTAHPTCEVTATQVNTYVSALGWPNIGGGAVTPATTYPDGNENVGSHVQVTVSYVFNITMPFVPTKSINMSSTAKATILQ